MSSTVRSLKGLVTKRNDAAVNWLQNSTQALTDIQPKESARRIKSCDRYIDLLETSLTKLTKAFDEAPETTEEEEDHLDKYIEKTQATIMKLHDHRTQLEETLEDIGIEADDRSSPSAVSRLPVIPIPTFTGRKWEWDNFWALYKANVHDQNLSQLQKFNYLLASLSGEAKQSVSRFFVSANNYEKAIQHLTKRYGNKDGIILELNRSLHNCVAKGPSTMEQRQLWDKLSTIAAQLEEHEQQLNNQLTIQIFVQKFHTRIRKAAMEKRLRQQDEHRSEWTLDQWLDAIDNVISQEEQLNHMLSFEGQFRNYSLHSGTAARVPQESKGTWKAGAPCERCGNRGHRWTNCPQIPTAIQKRRFLLETNRCLNCGSNNHRVVSCPSGNCRKCHRKHHTAICLENIPRKSGTLNNRLMNGQKRRTSIADSVSSSDSSSSGPSTKEAQVTTTSAVMTTAPTQQKKSSSSSTVFNLDTDPSVTIALARATAKPSGAQSRSTFGLSNVSSIDDDGSSKDEIITVHRLWERFLDFTKKVERQHQEVQEWMQSMKRLATFATQERRDTSRNREMTYTQQKKSLQGASHKRPQSSERAARPKNEMRRRHFNDHRHLRKTFASSQKKSSRATSLQKDSGSEKWRRNVASGPKAIQKGKKHECSTVNGQRRQAPARSKKEGSQKKPKAKRPVGRSGQAGAYELHSYQSTRASEHGVKHSNVGDKSSRHREENKQTHKRSTKISTVDITRRLTRQVEGRTITSEKRQTVLAREQTPGETTENMVHSTQFESEVARRKRWCQTTLCAPWQGAFYKRIMRCIGKTLCYMLGVLAMAFNGSRMTLTKTKCVDSTAPKRAVPDPKGWKKRTESLQKWTIPQTISHRTGARRQNHATQGYSQLKDAELQSYEQHHGSQKAQWLPRLTRHQQ